jgi:hypothetical protein
MTVWIFFGIEEDGAGTGAGTGGGRDVAVSARGALAGGGAAGRAQSGRPPQIRGRSAERRSGWEAVTPAARPAGTEQAVSCADRKHLHLWTPRQGSNPLARCEWLDA